MSILANTTSQIISTTDIKYLKGRKAVREYDSCYYEIGSADLSQEQMDELNAKGADGVRIKVKVTKASQMNVYLYGGPSRFNATESIVSDNA